MIDAGIAQPWPAEAVEAVSRFKQGDLVERPPFFYVASSHFGIWRLTTAGGNPVLTDELFEVDPEDAPPYGLITTQTCDLDEQSPRPRQPWFMVAPVYRADDLLDQSQWSQVQHGMIGYLVSLEPSGLPGGFWVADLRIELPLEKSWLVGRDPIVAFPGEEGYLRLARRLARRRERPALANELSEGIVRSLRDGFRRLGKARRSALVSEIREIRLSVTGTRVKPSAASLLIIAHAGSPPKQVTEWFDNWWDEARQRCQEQGVTLLGNRYTTLDALSAADYVSSVPLDFDYLSPDDD